jgi:hypothetical protein
MVTFVRSRTVAKVDSGLVVLRWIRGGHSVYGSDLDEYKMNINTTTICMHGGYTWSWRPRVICGQVTTPAHRRRASAKLISSECTAMVCERMLQTRAAA